MANALKVVDLFSGCGGSALGFSLAGFPIKVAVDNDLKASESFKINFPEAHVFAEDITNLSGKDLLSAGKIQTGKEVLLIACPPCQGFSNARRQSERMADPRNKLIYEFLRLVKEIGPSVFVMENVPGLATGIGKPLFKDILEKLHELGYQTVYGVVNAADYGIPQKRKRLILYGTNRNDIRLTFPLKSNGDPNVSPDLSSWKTVRDAISDLPKIDAGVKNEKDKMHAAANLSTTNLERIKHTSHNGGSRTDWPDNLVLDCHKKSNGHMDVYGRMKWDEPSPTITGGCVMISKGRFGHPDQDRAISLREAARLQTFPDSFQFFGNTGEIAKQIGNAVPPLLAKKAALAICDAMNERSSYKRVTGNSLTGFKNKFLQSFK